MLFDSSNLIARARRTLVELIFWAAFAYTFFAHLSWLNEPWDSSLAGINGGSYYGYACRAFDSHGFFANQMQGPLIYNKGGELYIPYTNHPATAYWLLYPCYLLFGQDEGALRLAILLVFVVIALTLRYLLARIIGAEKAALAGALTLTTPMMVYYGNMVDLAMFCMAASLICFYAWFRYRESASGKGYKLYFATAFAAGMIDWFCYFVGIALILDILCNTSGLRNRVNKVLLAGIPFLVAFAVVIAWLSWAEGNFDRLAKLGNRLSIAVRGTGSEITRYSDTSPYTAMDGSWFRANLNHLVTVFGWPLLLLATVGLVTGALRQNEKKCWRLGILILLAGFLPMLAFRQHAMAHPFWTFNATAGLSMLALIAIYSLMALFHRIRGIGLLLLVVIVAVGTWNGIQGKAMHKQFAFFNSKLRGHAYNEVFGPRDLVFTSMGLSADRYYTNSTIIPHTKTFPVFKHSLQFMKADAENFDRVFLIWYLGENIDQNWIKDNIPVVRFWHQTFDTWPVIVVETDRDRIFSDF